MRESYQLNDTIIIRHEGRKYRVFVKDIARHRTLYYSVVDAFAEGSKEWEEEFDYSMNRFEVMDWYKNSMDFADIQPNAKLIERRESKMTQQEINNNYQYHSLEGDQQEKYVAIRAKAKELAQLVNEVCPASRELSVGHTQLETAVMWFNASILPEMVDNDP